MTGDKQIPFNQQLQPDEPLIVSNDRQTFIRQAYSKTQAKLSREMFFDLCPASVIDKESLQLIQILDLHKTIDHTQSVIGSATLLRSLIQPSFNIDHILSKQEALRELAADQRLYHSLNELMHEFSSGENALFKFFNKELNASFPYIDFNMAKVSASHMKKLTINAQSPYLKALISSLEAYRGSPIDLMMSGSVYRTFTGFKSEKEVRLFTPKLKFTPRRFTKWMWAGPAVAVVPYLQKILEWLPAFSPHLTTIGLIWTAISTFYGIFIKPVRDTENFIEPLRRQCILDTVFNRAVDAVGMIDELLSLYKMTKQSQYPMCQPKILDENHHFINLDGMINPVLAQEIPDMVSNNIRLKGSRLTFISGPNSGGKTTLCKSIVQNQVLAQIGAHVFAEKAEINIAEMIRYQAPRFDGLHDEEGRFGTELKRTRDIFFTTTPKSLVVLDELAEGTTAEETYHHSKGILEDFYTIGNNTLLVTHNHSLISAFTNEQIGQSVMMEFKDDEPTYRTVPGISKVSHSEKIASKIKFSKKDRHHYLVQKGYKSS